MLVSSVTAPLLAKALPSKMDARLPRVMLSNARIWPTNAVSAPRVAELPTCQNTLLPEDAPPWIVTTDELLAVVSVLPI